MIGQQIPLLASALVALTTGTSLAESPLQIARQGSLEAGGQVIYLDGDHLTASYSRTLAAVLFQRLRDSEQ